MPAIPGFGGGFYTAPRAAIPLPPGGFTQGSVPFGDAFGGLTQDNANFFWDDAADTLLLGDTLFVQTVIKVGGDPTIFGTEALQVVGTTQNNTRFFTGAVGSLLQFSHARGTEAVPVTLSSGDDHYRIQGRGFDGAAFVAGTEIVSETTELWAAGANGASLLFRTTPNTTAVAADALLLDEDQTARFFANVGMGIAPIAGIRLAVEGGIELTRSANPFMLFDISGTPVAQLRGIAVNELAITNGTGATRILHVNTTTFDVGISVTPTAGKLHIVQASDAPTLFIDSAATTAHVTQVDAPTTTTGSVIRVNDADALTTGFLLELHSDSADVSARFLADIVNDNAAAVGTNVLRLQQHAPAANALVINDGASNTVTILGNGSSSIGGTPLTNEGDWYLAKDGVLAMDETTTPTADAAVAKLYSKSDNMLYFQDGAGVEHAIGGGVTFKSYTVTTQGIGGGIVYAAGFYDAPAADANLTQASATTTVGGANSAIGAHAFLVGGGVGTAGGGAGPVEIEVSGTSFTDAGVRTAADTEVIIADVTTMSLDGYAETLKKWIGTVTFTIQNAGGSTQTVFTADFNFGLAKYEDFGNRDFTISDFEVTGLAGASDSSFDIQLFHHTTTGWTYSAAAFVPGGDIIVDMNTDYSTEQDLVSGDPFAYKRTGLAVAVAGSGEAGVVAAFTTGVNNAIEFAEAHIGVDF